MMRRGSVRHVFPGGNTSRGFVSFYDHISPVSDGYSFILKGGPGTGKSTFMKRIAQELLTLGVNVEMHHCSADADSVDAVAFPAIGVAIIDGTAPHVHEPVHYNVNGEIVDLGQFCDGATVQRRHKNEIGNVTAQARSAFRRAYRYLAAARSVREDWEASNRAARQDALLHETTTSLIATIFEKQSISRGTGHLRRLFVTSITPDGPVHHLDVLVGSSKHVFIVTGEPGSGRAHLMSKVGEAAVARGYDVELYHCAFEPEDVDHVLIPALDTVVISSVAPHLLDGVNAFDVPARRQIDLNAGLMDNIRKDALPYIETARATFWQLFRHGITSLKDAQRLHLQLESFYAPYMNFDAVEQMRQTIRDRIVAIGEHALPSISSR